MIDIQAVNVAGDSLRVVTTEGVVLSVPPVASNMHYLAVKKWVENGGVIGPELDHEPSVPQVVSRFQVLAALHLAGLLSQVESLIADPAVDAITRLAWVNAQEFKRDSPTLLAVASALSLTEEQLDNMFIQAAAITA